MLHVACRLGLADIARLLLDTGADPHARDTLGRTPELVALGLNQADCADLFYNMAIRSSPDPSRVAHSGQRATETARSHQNLGATAEDKPGERGFYHHSSKRWVGGKERGGGRSPLGSQWEGRDSTELGGWDPTKNVSATGIWGGQEGEILQNGGDSTALRGREIGKKGLGAGGEAVIRQPEEEFASTADIRRQSLHVDFVEAVAIARRASGAVLPAEQQQMTLITAPFGSRGKEVGQVSAEHIGVEGSEQHDVERGDEGGWTWSAAEGWVVAGASVEQEFPSAVEDVRDSRDGGDVFRQPHRSASYSGWKSSNIVGSGGGDGGNVDDAQQWPQGDHGTSPEDRAMGRGSDKNQTQPYHHHRLRDDGPRSTVDPRDINRESHRGPPGGYDKQGGDGAADYGAQSVHLGKELADDGPNNSGGSYADEKDSTELPAPTARGAVDGGTTRDVASSVGWGGVASVLRAKHKWMSLVDRESGSIYYLDKQSGLTQWEAPEDGADVASGDDHAGDDASTN